MLTCLISFSISPARMTNGPRTAYSILITFGFIESNVNVFVDAIVRLLPCSKLTHDCDGFDTADNDKVLKWWWFLADRRLLLRAPLLNTVFKQRLLIIFAYFLTLITPCSWSNRLSHSFCYLDGKTNTIKNKWLLGMTDTYAINTVSASTVWVELFVWSAKCFWLCVWELYLVWVRYSGAVGRKGKHFTLALYSVKWHKILSWQMTGNSVRIFCSFLKLLIDCSLLCFARDAHSIELSTVHAKIKTNIKCILQHQLDFVYDNFKEWTDNVHNEIIISVEYAYQYDET